MWVVLRLKLIADAGLLGLPNAGKSTFLSAVSRARPKIADYPFTTIRPQLGVVGFDSNEFVMADIPGLIEGASEGVGLGHRFLGHVERCGILLHLIDGTQEDVVDAYETITNEVNEYGGDLIGKPIIIGLNKCDALLEEEIEEKKALLETASGAPVLTLSGATGGGVTDVLAALWQVISTERAQEQEKLNAEARALEQKFGDNDGDEPASEWSPLS
jgi:GTP-binding protein